MQTVARSIDAPSIDPSLQQLQDARCTVCAQPRPAGKPPGAPPSLFPFKIMHPASCAAQFLVCASRVREPGGCPSALVRGADRMSPRTLSDIQMRLNGTCVRGRMGRVGVVAAVVVRGLSGETLDSDRIQYSLTSVQSGDMSHTL